MAPPETTEDNGPLPGRTAMTGSNAVTVSAEQGNIPVNGEGNFTIRVQADAPLSSLALNGAVNGGPSEIMEIRTDSLSENDVRILKNISGNSFDVGLTFSRDSGPILAASYIQLKVKFPRKGNYVLNIGGIQAYDAKRNRVEIAPASCPIEIY